MRKDFSKLKELRSNKQKNTFQDNDLAPIYDEVTEMEYNQIAKRALLEDDFIVDDNGQGYVGRGLEDWDTKQESSESDISDLDQDDTKKVRKSPKVKKRKIQDLFNGLKKTTTTVKKEVLPQKKDQDILGDILMDLDNDLVAKTGDIDQKFKQKKLSSTQANPRFSEMGSFNNANVVIKNEFSQYGEVKIKSEFPETDNNFGSTMDDFHNSDDDDDFVDEIKVKQEYPEVVVKKEVVLQAPKIAKIQAKKLSSQANQKFLPQFIKKEEVDLPVVLEQSQTKSNWSELKDKFQVQAGVIDELPAETSGYYESSDSTTYFYYLDCYEKKGKVYLFGKVFDNNRYVSCCLTINNMERNLFLLPKQNSDVTMMDVYQEFDVLRKKMGISNFKSKPVERNYCFELPGIPSKAEYLKVVYSFSEPELPMDFSGKTFTKVFGTNTKALELFLIKRKIMGPCWLKINGALRSSKHISFCNLELQIESPKSVSVVGNDGEDGVPKEAPPLVVMSLNLRTLMNLEKSTNEIVLCGILIYQNVNQDGETLNPTGLQKTLIRKVENVPWPADFDTLLQQDMNANLQKEENERALLNRLISLILRHDPDVIVGHNVIDFDLDVLLQRMKHHKVTNWSCLGRLKRSEWPKMQGGAGGTNNSTFAERAIASGRLLCDTFRAAQDFLSSAKSYSLSSLAMSQFKESRPDIQYDKIASYFWNAEELVEMIKHSRYDTYLVMNLMFKLQVIPLTKQLTNLAGNLWSRTMTGARAERNEFLLLHEFHANKFITPDKVFNEVSKNTAAGKKKAAYAGGLVLEPKAGLYDKYVLLLDFNSLYPSIIQEFNICFSTVTRQNENVEDCELPDIPEQDLEAGILPRLLKSLVERRKQVKALMKQKDLSVNQLSSFDIRQKALKLTANSMYGCLGFVHSRFYAKPIAMLITSKGREILQNTVNLAESLAMDVIYGDTDSIMINTNSLDIKQVKSIAAKLSKQVNAQYKKLEIEMDGLFKRLLLLKKKKYAALCVTEKDGKLIETLEYKGLDIVRRDWCEYSHQVCAYVLKQIFTEASTEETVDRIHLYLAEIAKLVREGKVDNTLFVVNKGLTKSPKEYADKDSQPHVQVALKMIANGLTARAGDTIPYVICEGEGPMARRAYHIDDVMKPDSGLHLDLEWYLANQIHPPIARLCATIEGTDSSRLAFAMGLDVRKYETLKTSSYEEPGLEMLDSQYTDSERFKNVSKWNVKCPSCRVVTEINSVLKENEDGHLVSALKCSNEECGQEFPPSFLQMDLKRQVRKAMNSYLKQVVKCEEATCQMETKFVGVYPLKCLKPRCNGLVHLKYSDFAFHAQLQYYEALADHSKLLKKFPEQKERVQQILLDEQESVLGLHKVIDGTLQCYARNWVDLDRVFQFKF